MNRDRVCREFEDALTLYHYGELGPDESAALKRHLADCAGCRAGLAELESVLGVLDGRGAMYEPGAAETARAAAGVMERLAKKRRLWPRLVPALAAAAAVAFIALTGVFDNSPFKGAKAPAPTPAVTEAPAEAPARAPARETARETAEAPELAVAEAPAPAEGVLAAQADWELLENIDVLAELDVLENLELLEGMEEL